MVVTGAGKPAARRESRDLVMKDARAEAERWSLKMASLPMTIISMRSHLPLLLPAQAMISESCVSASARPSSSWMPMIIFRP